MGYLYCISTFAREGCGGAQDLFAASDLDDWSVWGECTVTLATGPGQRWARLADTAANGQHGIYQALTIDVPTIIATSQPAPIWHCLSAIALADSLHHLVLVNDAQARAFDLSGGTVGSVVSGTEGAQVAWVDALGSGEYRCSLAVEIAATTFDDQIGVTLSTGGTTVSYVGDGSGLYVRGLAYQPMRKYPI